MGLELELGLGLGLGAGAGAGITLTLPQTCNGLRASAGEAGAAGAVRCLSPPLWAELRWLSPPAACSRWSSSMATTHLVRVRGRVRVAWLGLGVGLGLGLG